VYGSVRTVVWQGSVGDRRPYADQISIALINRPMSAPLISRTIVYNQEAKERQCEYSGGLVQSDDDYS
jgi:hypothetical protein